MSELRPTRSGTWSAILWVVAIAVVILVAIPVGAALNWWTMPFRMYSPDNIASLSRQANESWQSLEAQNASINVVERKINDFLLTYGEDQSKWPQGKSSEIQQLRSELSNKITAYNAACGQYQAMWLDEWRDFPAPDDLPKTCEMK